MTDAELREIASREPIPLETRIEEAESKLQLSPPRNAVDRDHKRGRAVKDGCLAYLAESDEISNACITLAEKQCKLSLSVWADVKSSFQNIISLGSFARQGIRSSPPERFEL